MVVLATVQHWNQSVVIDLFWTQSACPRHCVPVRRGNYGATAWVGRTTYSYWPSTNEFASGTMEIRLNDYYAPWKRNLACHEIGHALGLGHNSAQSSCLWHANQQREFPNADDWSTLRYDVGH